MIYANTYTEKYITPSEPDKLEELRLAAASNLMEYSEHQAGGGSFYIYVGGVKIRFSDHSNTSSSFESPDYNIVSREISDKEIQEIIQKAKMPKHVKTRAFGWFFGLTVPKLKNILPEEMFDHLVIDESYPNTKTAFVNTNKAVKFLRDLGYKDTFPVRQEKYSIEDYNGGN